MKDYYKILGVIRTAEDVVIKAAYRALAQKYHPDKFDGLAETALKMMQEINEAYSVLSDIDTRNEYNSIYDKEINESFEFEEDEVFFDEIEKTWNEVIEYFPDLIDISHGLSKISKGLVHTLKYHLIETKDFDNRLLIAKTIENLYLNNYFGSNDELVEFGKTLILCKYKNAAKKLNRAVNILGSNIDPKIIINKISEDEFTNTEIVFLRLVMNCSEEAKRRSKYLLKIGFPNSIFRSFINEFGGELNMQFISKYILYIGGISTEFQSAEEVEKFCIKLANTVI